MKPKMVKIIDEDRTYYITLKEAELIESAKTFALPIIIESNKKENEKWKVINTWGLYTIKKRGIITSPT